MWHVCLKEGCNGLYFTFLGAQSIKNHHITVIFVFISISVYLINIKRQKKICLQYIPFAEKQRVKPKGVHKIRVDLLDESRDL